MLLRKLSQSPAKKKLALQSLVEEHGSIENLGPCFEEAERPTSVEVGLIRLQKPGGGYQQEFDGFFLFEEQEPSQNGIMPYNVVRDLVNRYVEAVKIFDEQLSTAARINELIEGFFSSSIAMSLSSAGHHSRRNEFKKELQKSGWDHLFRMLNLEKYSTKSLREDLNKFVESQSHIPFTMRNIYRMLEIVAGTTTQRMDKALLEVFDKLTTHYHENRYQVEGWKTNSHYLVNKRFILPYMCYQDQRFYKGETRIQYDNRGNCEFVEDLVKALCYISGDDYEHIGPLWLWISNSYTILTDKKILFKRDADNYREAAKKAGQLPPQGIAFTLVDHRPVYGEWFDWAYFRVKAFKKGSMHFEFKDEDLWGRFNQRIARLKNYPLFEAKPQKARQKRAGQASAVV